MGKSNALKGCYITLVGQPRNHTTADFKKWIKGNGGKDESKITDNTTHLVVGSKAWQNQVPEVLKALKINREMDPEIRIVSYDWLEDSLTEYRKKRETPYLWEKLKPEFMKKANGGRSAKSGIQVNGDSGSKTTPSMILDVLKDSTDSFLNEKEKREIEKKAEHQRRAQEEMDAEEKQEKETALKKSTAVFKRGAEKAKNQLLSENHHIYEDETHFKYDVQLTKVDTRHNKNERWALTLQIYESNSKPHTYVMNAQFASTGNQPANNIVAAVGTNFPTVFRVFKNTFRQHTGGEWDNRIRDAIERNKREKLERGQASGSDVGTVKGIPVSESAALPMVKTHTDFAAEPFLYHPPRYGSKGALPQVGTAVQDQSALVSSSNQQQPSEIERIETWMSGAKGAEPVKPQDSQSVGDQTENGQACAPDLNLRLVDNVEEGILENNSAGERTAYDVAMSFDFDTPAPEENLGSEAGGVNDCAVANTVNSARRKPEAGKINTTPQYQSSQIVGEETQIATDTRDAFEDFMDEAVYGTWTETGTKGTASSTPKLGQSIPAKRSSPAGAYDEHNLRTKFVRAAVESGIEDA